MSRARIRRTKERVRKQRRNLLVLAFFALIIIPLIATVSGSVVAGAAILSEIPQLKNEGDIQNWQTTKIFAADGTLLTNLYYEQDRIVVPLSGISLHLQQAVIAIEDERYYKHQGYDPEAIARAFFANISKGRVVEGASTITQQYVKNTIISREKTFDRKIKEAALAYQLEQKYTKDEILEKYLNTIYFGHSWYGVETASLNYFGKHAKDLTLTEAAMLAGVIKAPNTYSPYISITIAKSRRDIVLANMLRLKFITKKQYKEASTLPLVVKPIRKPTSIAPYFVEYVKQELIKKYGENVVFKGGLRVYTTIDLKMQVAAENAAWNILNRPNDPSVAIAAVEPKTGYIRAMVGGRDFNKNKYNYALSHNRQPGSSFKTFVFIAALESGMSPFETFESSPVTIPIPGSEPWQVNNYSEGSGGPPMTIREGLIRSVNTVYARLIMEVGSKKVAELAQKMGIGITINPNPAIALGGFGHGPSVLDMASAYSTIANDGKHCATTPIASITDASYKTIDEFKPKPVQVIGEASAYIATDVLEDVIAYGTGGRARLNRPCAGKTGTAQEYRDAWFCGFTPDLAAAVWVGYPKNAKTSMYNVHGVRVAGGTFPAMIWNKFMTEALKGKPKTNFVKPKGGIIEALICTQTGLLANKYCPEIEYRPFVSNKVPRTKCELHSKPAIVAIPRVTGLKEAEATKELDAAHFEYKIEYAGNDNVPQGVVYEQVPAGDEKARQGATILLTVSTGSPDQAIRVPNVVGFGEQDAVRRINDLGLKVIDVTATPYVQERSKRDKVVYQVPEANTELNYGQVVTIYINRKR